MSWSPQVRFSAEELAAHFSVALKDVFDCAVRSAIAIAVGTTLDPAPIEMPLCVNEAHFSDVATSAALRGLRPDQLEIIRAFQPFVDTSADRGTQAFVRQALSHLEAISRPRDQGGRASRLGSLCSTRVPQRERRQDRLHSPG